MKLSSWVFSACSSKLPLSSRSASTETSGNGGGATASVNVAENTTAVTTVVATDADLPAQTITYSIIGGSDAAKFTIDASTGVLSFVTAPDYEAPTDANADNVYDVIVQASDGTYADLQAIAVTVTPVNDAPVLTAGATLAYTENGPAAVIDNTITITDIDSANLVGAMVVISGNYQNGQDVLAFVNASGITGNFVAGTGTLTLTGSSSEDRMPRRYRRRSRCLRTSSKSRGRQIFRVAGSPRRSW